MVGVTEFVAYKGLLLPSFTRKDVLVVQGIDANDKLGYKKTAQLW